MEEKKMRVSLFYGSNKIKTVILRTLLAKGLEVELFNGLNEATFPDHDIIFFDYDIEDPEKDTLLDKIWRYSPDSKVILISQKKDKGDLINLFSKVKLTNLIANNLGVSEEELLVTTEKILTGNIFGLDKYLAFGSSLRERKITSSDEKSVVLSELSNFFEDCAVKKSFIELSQAISDELLLNAIFHAPIASDGKRKYAHLERNSLIKLEDRESFTFRYGTDGRFIGLSVIDNFGSLAAVDILLYLAKRFEMNKYVSTEDLGAGLGIFIIFESADKFIINLAEGEKTEIIALIDIRGTMRDFNERAKSFHIFLKEAK